MPLVIPHRTTCPPGPKPKAKLAPTASSNSTGVSNNAATETPNEEKKPREHLSPDDPGSDFSDGEKTRQRMRRNQSKTMMLNGKSCSRGSIKKKKIEDK